MFQGNTVELPEEENTPEKRVDRIFAMMDKVYRYIKHCSNPKPPPWVKIELCNYLFIAILLLVVQRIDHFVSQVSGSTIVMS